ncbi:hypothetical protein [Salinarimonas rosea]|uniref:hypothetical protein n=1 Tax=Salinarimonas rosea TaxID=552063 RepID=UPI0012EB9D25|nr:hypothetical protein [Salinarimonas rosea]
MLLERDGGMVRGVMLAVALAAATALPGCEEAWTGFVQPKRGNVLGVVEIGSFRSLEECRLAAREALARAGWADGDYACGQGCRERAGVYGPFTCVRTES